MTDSGHVSRLVKFHYRLLSALRPLFLTVCLKPISNLMNNSVVCPELRRYHMVVLGYLVYRWIPPFYLAVKHRRVYIGVYALQIVTDGRPHCYFYPTLSSVSTYLSVTHSPLTGRWHSSQKRPSGSQP